MPARKTDCSTCHGSLSHATNIAYGGMCPETATRERQRKLEYDYTEAGENRRMRYEASMKGILTIERKRARHKRERQEEL